jgi:hypothetical protein
LRQDNYITSGSALSIVGGEKNANFSGRATHSLREALHLRGDTLRFVLARVPESNSFPCPGTNKDRNRMGSVKKKRRKKIAKHKRRKQLKALRHKKK